MRERTLEYWMNCKISHLGFARMIREKLPWYLKIFTKIYVDTYLLDELCDVIRVYYSYKNYASPSLKGKRFCCEFTLDDIETEANGDSTISSRKRKRV